MKLNIGCGDDVREGYLNVDIIKGKGIKVIDLNKYPYPFKSNTFDEVLALNIIEHLDSNKAFNELHRITKNGGIIKLQVPHFTSGNAWSNIEHKRPFSMNMFRMDNMTNRFKILYMHLVFKSIFKPIEWFANKFPKLYEYQLAFIFPSGDLNVELEVIK